jgi:hypothetical protein
MHPRAGSDDRHTDAADTMSGEKIQRDNAGSTSAITRRKRRILPIRFSVAKEPPAFRVDIM